MLKRITDSQGGGHATGILSVICSGSRISGARILGYCDFLTCVHAETTCCLDADLSAEACAQDSL